MSPFFDHNNMNLSNSSTHLVMYDNLYLQKYIAPKSTRISEILQGFRTFYDELNKYKAVIKEKLMNHPDILNMNVSQYNLNHVEQILKGNILEKTLRQFNPTPAPQKKKPKNLSFNP